MEQPNHPVDRHESYIELAKLTHSFFADRAGREWRVTLAIWALIVGAVLHGVTLPWWLWTVVVIVYGLMWLRPAAASHADDKLLREHYVAAADTVLRDAKAAIGPRPDRLSGCCRHVRWLKDWSIQFQFVATIVLVVAAALNTATKSVPPSNGSGDSTAITVNGARVGASGHTTRPSSQP